MTLIYQPSDDSILIEQVIKKYAKNKSVLDMCAGTGILAIKAINEKAKSVTAVDINKEAINSIKENKIKKIHSNLFKNIKNKFDLIICNPPYLPKDKREDKESSIATTGGKMGDELILKFLRQSKSHLKRKGIILLLISSLTPKRRINKLLKELNFKSKIIAEKKLFFESLYVLEIKF